MRIPAVRSALPWRQRLAATIDGLREPRGQRMLAAAALVAIVVAGGWLRLSGVNWDSGAHLHPDERYVTQVADNIRWPDSIGQYLDVHGSPLSPYNTEPGRAYLYGQLPLFGTKLVATAVGQDDYDHLNIVGRHLSAILDTGSIVLVFLLALMLFGPLRRTTAVFGALLAAALYAFTVTAIQTAHFFTMESWLVFFSLLTFVLAAHAVRTSIGGSTSRFRLIHVLIGASLGLTVACKASGGLVAIPVVIGLLGETALTTRRVGGPDAFLRACASGLSIVVAAYVAFRAVSPYAFANSSWLDVRINPAFRDALTAQQNAIEGKVLYPPAYQWLLSPRLLDPLKNLVLWQLGVLLGIAALAGLGAIGFAVLRPLPWLWRRGKRPELGPERQAALTVFLMLLAFVVIVFVYFGSQFAHTGRYQLPLVPFVVLAAAYGLLALVPGRPAAIPVATALIAGTTALFALAYHHIYTEPNTRIAATSWIAEHVPPGTTIANEHWDDSLPVGGLAQKYKGEVLAVFDPDDDTKLRKLYDGLSASDYYFISSPRAWRTIGRLPGRFPIMPRFYKALFAGRLGFARVARFTSEPELFGVRLHDVGAEEAFWVYDHPPVLIYRKFRPLSWPEFRRRLCEPAPAPPGCSRL